MARYGGEEFAVILPGASREVAHALAERLRLAVGRVTAAGPAGSVTASLGLAVCPSGSVSAAELIRAADQALYRSKERGRNQVTVSELVDRAATIGPRPATAVVAHEEHRTPAQLPGVTGS